MKRSTLLRHLRFHGCYLKREGGSHSLWCNPANGVVEAVPRRMQDPGYSDRPVQITVAVDEDITRLDPGRVPLIEDFGIRLVDCGDMGMHVHFFSRDEQLDLASFPWWDHAEADLRNWSLDNVPLGSTETPYDEPEQGWRIVIWERDDCVLVAEGDDPGCTQFQACFRVLRATYMAAWEHVIHEARVLGEPVER